jgi:exopolysaccharide biosynthesis operon protein EpsL
MAAFDPTDAFQIYANVGVTHDNNLFRLPDAPPQLFGVNPDNKSDTLLTKGVGLKFDKEYSRQHLIADANLYQTTFDKNSDLDYTGYYGRVAWLWRVGNDWDGEASYRKRKTLGGFSDELLKAKDLIETTNYLFSGGYQFGARWRLGAELTKQDQEHSALNQRRLDLDAKAAAVDLTYRTPADNSIVLQARRTDRDYPFLSVNNHHEDRITTTGLWRISGLLRLEGQVGHVDVSHDQAVIRDFSGYTWRAGGVWDATGKFRVSLNGYKDIRLYEDRATSYIVAHGVNIAPLYAITAKINLQGSFIWERREFRGVGDPDFVIGSQREDIFRFGRVALTYQPLRFVDLSLSFESGDRSSNVVVSNISINSYDYQAWMATAKISW